MLFIDRLFEVEDVFRHTLHEEQLYTTVTRYARLPAQEFLTVSSATFASFPTQIVRRRCLRCGNGSQHTG